MCPLAKREAARRAGVTTTPASAYRDVGSFESVSSPLVPAEPFTLLDASHRRTHNVRSPLRRALLRVVGRAEIREPVLADRPSIVNEWS
jgi:hypothetical protein